MIALDALESLHEDLRKEVLDEFSQYKGKYEKFQSEQFAKLKNEIEQAYNEFKVSSEILFCRVIDCVTENCISDLVVK